MAGFRADEQEHFGCTTPKIIVWLRSLGSLVLVMKTHALHCVMYKCSDPKMDPRLATSFLERLHMYRQLQSRAVAWRWRGQMP